MIWNTTNHIQRKTLLIGILRTRGPYLEVINNSLHAKNVESHQHWKYATPAI